MKLPFPIGLPCSVGLFLLLGLLPQAWVSAQSAAQMTSIHERSIDAVRIPSVPPRNPSAPPRNTATPRDPSAPPLRIAEAVIRALDVSLDLTRQDALVEQSRARRTQRALFANPVADYTREDLRANDRSLFEWTVTVDYPILSLFTRGARISAADLELQAAIHRRTWTRAAVRHEARHAFLDAWEARETLGALETIEPVVRALDTATALRAREGDIAVYDRQRLRTALSSLQWRVGEATEERRSADAALAFLLSLPADSLARIPLTLPDFIFNDVDLPELLRSGLRDREDVRALRAEHDALAQQRSWLRTQWLDDLRIGGGYKRQSDAFAGPVLSVSLPIPLLDRNQGATAETVAGQNHVSAELHALEQRIENEITRAAAAYRQMHARKSAMRALDAAELAQLLETATAAFEEGEFTVVEYLDAVAAYVDGMQLDARMRTALLRAAYDLEYATGNGAIITQEPN